MRSKSLFSPSRVLFTGAVLACCLGGSLFALNVTSAQNTKPAVKPDTNKPATNPPAAPDGASQPNAKNEQLSLIDTAKKQGANCIPALTKLSQLTLGNANYSAVTQTHKEVPAQHIFTALNFLNYPNMPAAPYGLSVLVTAPNRNNNCDSENVNIHPTASSCEEVAASLAKENYVPEQNSGPLIVYPVNNGGQRTLLMRTASTGCIVVSTGSYFDLN